MTLFSSRERRGVLLFLGLMLLLGVGLKLVQSRRLTGRLVMASSNEQSTDSLHLFPFDPNTISYDSLKLLGFSKSQARQLIHYREAGKVYRLAEDLDAIYGMTDSLFQRIRPYVHIGEAYRLKPHLDTVWEQNFPSSPRRVFQPPTSPFCLDTVSADYLQSLGFSVRWSKALVDCARRRGIRSEAELRELRFVGDSVADLLLPWLRFPQPQCDPFEERVELNRADSASLVAVYGIGEKTAGEILHYRKRLGGFYRVEQLAEVKGVTEANYEKILQQIWCDSFLIQKIDINFAPARELREHPYLPPHIFRKLISKRQQRKSKGGWSTVEEMVDENILTEREAERLRPYLRFGTQTLEERN